MSTEYHYHVHCIVVFAARETLLLPLMVSDLLGKVDTEVDVELGGPTGQAGAIRLGLSRALLAFVEDDVKEKMRLCKFRFEKL